MSKNETTLIPTSEEMNVYQVMAKTATQSKFFDKIGGESGLLSIMLMARELGLPPLQSLMGGMNVIQGKVELSPRLMNSMIRKAGHRIEILESTDQSCKLKGVRCDTKEDYTCSFSIDDARRAGLVRSGGGWEKWASDMLFARCLSRLARRLFADIISTAYIEGEIDRESSDYRQVPVQDIQIETRAADPAIKENKPTITLEAFIVELSKLDTEFTGLRLDEYLINLSEKKQVPIHTIMEQALSPSLAPAFIKGYKKWYERTSEPQVTISEAIDKV